MSRTLDVYLGQTAAGTLLQDDDGALVFTYRDDYLGRDDRRQISVSMPLDDKPYPDRIARPYFSGLLPDENARRRLAENLGISESNPFGLLEVIGGECAGALSLYHADEAPPDEDSHDLEILTQTRLTGILETLRTRPLLGGVDGVRLSLAGAQDKLAVCVEGDAIGLARGGRPTTHILKPFIAALEGTVENEYFCMRLARRLALAAPPVSIGRVADIPYLLVERYDRHRHDDGRISRIHQEDFCQALSVRPELKYEAEGGPGVAASLDLIARASMRPAADRLTFIRMNIFHYLVGNSDAHAKNYSLLYTDAAPALAPVYDALCTAAYPRLAKQMAMAIGGRAIPDTIQLQHWLSVVPETRGAQRLIVKDLRDMATAIVGEAELLRGILHDEGVDHAILDAILRVIGTRAEHLVRITQT